MKAFASVWLIMFLALVLHLLGYAVAILSHTFEIPEIELDVDPENLSLEQILFSGADDYSWHFRSNEIDRFVQELIQREQTLNERQSELNALKDHLSAERAELSALKEEIERRHKALSDEIRVIRRNEITNLRTLANSYSNITPRAAVAIFEHMDESLVVKILALMKPDVVAQIFEELARNGANDPAAVRRAAQLSEELRLHYKEP